MKEVVNNRNRFSVWCKGATYKFDSVSDAKRFIMLHLEDYRAHDGGYKAVMIKNGLNQYGVFRYYATAKKLIKIEGAKHIGY